MKDNKVENYCLFRVRFRRDYVCAKLFYDAVVIASDCVSYLKPVSSLVNTRDGPGSYPAHLAGERISGDEAMQFGPIEEHAKVGSLRCKETPRDFSFSNVRVGCVTLRVGATLG